jgi:hypothetical protein
MFVTGHCLLSVYGILKSSGTVILYSTSYDKIFYHSVNNAASVLQGTISKDFRLLENSPLAPT